MFAVRVWCGGATLGGLATFFRRGFKAKLTLSSVNLLTKNRIIKLIYIKF